MWLRSQLHHLLLLRLAQVDLPPALSVKLQTAALAPKGARARARAAAVSWETCGNSSCPYVHDATVYQANLQSRLNALSESSWDDKDDIHQGLPELPGRRSTGSND
jgi:hypothetical protein